jgi:AGZA family xanthine/uracil permease-like MFS transporter
MMDKSPLLLVPKYSADAEANGPEAFMRPPARMFRARLARYLDERFEVSLRDSTIFNEVKAGFISWMTMSYILVVNPVILSHAQTHHNHISQAALMSATAASSVVGCLLCGLWANMPLGLMPGMGLNAYFVFGICHTFKVSLQESLSCSFMSGLALLILSQSGVIHWLVKTVISQHLKNAITVAIGMFQAMIGFQIMGLVVGSPDTLVTLGDLSLSNHKLYVSLVGFGLLAVMSCQQVHGALLIGIWQIAICSWIIGICPPPDAVFLMPSFDLAGSIDFSGWKPGSGKLHGMLMGTTVLLFVSLFDLAGVQYGLCARGNLLKNGVVPKSTQIFSSAGLATMFGGLVGTSPLIIANESSAGIMEGAKTGLSTVICGFLFFLSAFMSPLLSAIPHVATAAPLVLIGAFMMGPISGIDWDNLNVSLPSFVTCTVVPFTYSIHSGIIAGILMDGLLCGVTWLCSCGKATATPPCTPLKYSSPNPLASPKLNAECAASSRQGSGRSTPTRRFQSPHAHCTIASLPGSDKACYTFMTDAHSIR